MKQFNSELFGIIQEPESVLELLAMIIGKSVGPKRYVKLWRGQGDIQWPINSGAYRRLLKEKGKVTEREIVNYEELLLDRARHKGYGFTDGMVLSDMELLARLQHHGAATRLVDFSKNSMVALWFCVNSLPSKTGLLLGFDTNQVGGNGEGVYDTFKSYSDAIGELSEYDHPMFIESPVVSKRIAAQHGVFLFSDVSNKKTGSLKIPEEGLNLFIVISPELKIQTRKVLIETFDIRTETLFPDLDGFSIANSVDENPKEVYRW
ncbi:FRG domain-containing protein [Peribacillus frigoritolerans]|uniref:FRG domain-containing protein n=1 Tax=Peribacillus frigoritolerans TaxID=450367 RepID=UPI00227F362C|nr:FRG domain-containing protein [Peribacillus frigoritolerans]MCY8935669.1 FRG domain-containing protein [Peribacillus frigoritolerans]